MTNRVVWIINALLLCTSSAIQLTFATVSGKVFTNNMSLKSEPRISICNPNENWTKVSFKPDLSKFNMIHLESDVVALMSKRVVDIAGCIGNGCKVELNGKRLPIKLFQDCVGLYLSTANANCEEPLPRFASLSHLMLFNALFFCHSVSLVSLLLLEHCLVSSINYLSSPTTFVHFHKYMTPHFPFTTTSEYRFVIDNY